MKGASPQRMDQRFRRLLPILLTLLLILLDAVPTRLPDFAAVSPLFPLIGIYYWAIFRPDLLGPVPAFLLGLANDIIAGLPLGVTPLVYLLVHWLTASQRRFFLGKPFLLAWWGFSVIALGSQALRWMLVSVIFGKAVDPLVVVVEIIVTICCYPLVSWAFARIQLGLMQNA